MSCHGTDCNYCTVLGRDDACDTIAFALMMKPKLHFLVFIQAFASSVRNFRSRGLALHYEFLVVYFVSTDLIFQFLRSQIYHLFI